MFAFDYKLHTDCRPFEAFELQDEAALNSSWKKVFELLLELNSEYVLGFWSYSNEAAGFMSLPDSASQIGQDTFLGVLDWPFQYYEICRIVIMKSLEFDRAFKFDTEDAYKRLKSVDLPGLEVVLAETYLAIYTR